MDNKKKPFFYGNIYKRGSGIRVIHKNLTFGRTVMLFGSTDEMINYKANAGTVKGLTYNWKTNTLTMKNYKQKDYIIVAHNMGSTFKIKLVGKNSCKYIECWGNYWPCGMQFTGSGSLEVNKGKADDGGIQLTSWYGDKFKIDAKAKITSYAAKGKSPVNLEFGEHRPALKNSTVIKFDSKKKKLNGKFVVGEKATYTQTYKFNKNKFVKK